MSEMRLQDEHFRLTLRTLHGVHNGNEEEYQRILAFLRDIANVEELTAVVHKLKADILNLRREAR